MPTIADYELRINLFHNSVSIIFALVCIWPPFFFSFVLCLLRAVYSFISFSLSISLTYKFLYTIVAVNGDFRQLCFMPFCHPSLIRNATPYRQPKWRTSNGIRHSIERIVVRSDFKNFRLYLFSISMKIWCTKFYVYLHGIHRKKATTGKKIWLFFARSTFWHNNYNCFEFATDFFFLFFLQPGRSIDFFAFV